jgi:hypothetical protein
MCFHTFILPNILYVAMPCSLVRRHKYSISDGCITSISRIEQQSILAAMKASNLTHLSCEQFSRSIYVRDI